jgi:putative ABC transport system permease protein
MSPRTLLYLYGWRLRAHPFQELLAGAGIAIGVALLFAVQVANHSITGSVEQLIHGITGQAQLELAARDEQGFDERLLLAVRGIPGVRAAAPTVERRALVEGPRGTRSLTLLGVDASLATLGGSITRTFAPGGLLLPRRGLLLADGIARTIGVPTAGTLTLKTAGRAYRTHVVTTLGQDQIGSLTGSGVAVGSLAWVQQLIGTPGSLSRIFVRADPGHEASVASQLKRISAGRYSVGPADSMVRQLEGVTAPDKQSTALFSAISATVGFLFAFNAMLLTLPERRRFVVELRTQGFTTGQVIVTLVFQAVVLGLLATAAGLLAGDLLSRHLFDSIPTYLSFTFPVGTQRIVPLTAVLIAVAAGVLASVLAASRSFIDLHGKRALDAVYQERGDVGEGFDPQLRRRLLAAAAGFAALAAVLALAAPAATIAAIGALAAALLCVTPTVFVVVTAWLDALARRLRWNMLVVAVIGARSTLTRSVAVAAIAALAVFGTITLRGARDDLIDGLFAGYTDHLATADVWVTSAGRSLTTDSFQIARAELARLREDRSIASVRVYQGGMYDVGGRRIWVIARPQADRAIVPASQLLEGNLQQANAQLHGTGWIALSTTLAHVYHVGVGDQIRIPTPSGPHRFRIAAITTNLSWGPGALIVNTGDYRRSWGSAVPSALEINTRPGVTPEAGRQLVEQALGKDGAYDIQTAAELDHEFQSVLLEGLDRLSQISMLMLVSAALALSAALSASIWHRRQRLAAYKVQGFKERQLRRILLLEALTVVCLGAVLGALVGIAGHLLCDRWLELTTGFSAPFSLRPGVALVSAGPVVLAAMMLVSLPGYVATRVAPELGFQS